MKATLIIVENDVDLAEAQALIHELMQADPTDAAATARLQAQARLVEAYEQRRWPPRRPRVADVIRYLIDRNGPVPRRPGRDASSHS